MRITRKYVEQLFADFVRATNLPVNNGSNRPYVALSYYNPGDCTHVWRVIEYNPVTHVEYNFFGNGRMTSAEIVAAMRMAMYIQSYHGRKENA